MLITRLSLNNFGLFAGNNDLYFRTDQSSQDGHRPIVLIGGLNGAGKSTIFEAIKLALYGPLAIGNRVKAADYERHLKKRIHYSNQRGTHPNEASLELEFEFTESGNIDVYRVRREWDVRSTKVNETLSIWKNDSILSDVNPDQWQDFVKELIPPGLSHLFFFDGEKIQSLAEDEENYDLADSIKSLLGLDIVEKLQTDLAIYMQKTKKSTTGQNVEDLEELQRRIAEKEESLLCLRQDQAQINSKIDNLMSRIEKQEARISSEGGQYASRKSELNEIKIQLDAEIEAIKNQIRDLCSDMLPFALAPNICHSLVEQLKKEEEYVRWESSSHYLKTLRAHFLDKLASKEFFKAIGTSSTKKNVNLVNQNIDEVFENLSDPPENIADLTIVHSLSESDSISLLTQLEKVLREVPKQARSLTQKLERRVEKRHEVEKQLGRAPSEESLKPLVDELSALHEELGTLKNAREDFRTRIKQTEFELSELQSKERKIVAALEKSAEDIDALNKASQVRQILQKYSQRLLAAKIYDLSENATKCFRKLSRKRDWVRKITIDPHDFSVHLYDHNNSELPKASLSAGEKQIYAVAMLWALGITSGRQLPVIIDTPLGRLDSQHRQQLVDNYFPSASHQVILLSTDTEVDQAYFSDLESHISVAYHLDFDQEEKRTAVSQGYFWPTTKRELTAHAAQ